MAQMYFSAYTLKPKYINKNKIKELLKEVPLCITIDDYAHT